PATLSVARRDHSVSIALVGDSTVIERHLSDHSTPLPDNVSVLHAPGTIAMDADPRAALRQADQSSMAVALALVQSGAADACISAGNSAALMLLARRLIGCVTGVEAPAFCKAMPVEQGMTLMLDLGANLHCDAERLVQFAHMGAVLAKTQGVAVPEVGLLNIGEEAGKGTRAIRDAANLLAGETGFHYAGFVEPDEIYSGQVQVLVCDGFSGNIALKTSEGVARLIGRKIEQALTRGWWRFPALLLTVPLARLRRDLNPDAYNGAVLAGLQQVVIKSHGGASEQAFANAVAMALEQVRDGVPEKIARSLQSRPVAH
ncbi:MAG TPA: phosphate acyltransferase PlsX, partial [Cellvibrionaceae bacterium]